MLWDIITMYVYCIVCLISAADRAPKKMIPQPAVPHFLTYIKLISGVCSFQNWKLEVSIPMAS